MYERLGIILEMIKIAHTLFALPFAMMAFALACTREGQFRFLDLVGVLVCMVFARSAAMGFNRWADRDVDALNPRTSARALPAGLVTKNEVLGFIIVMSSGFILGTGIFWLSSRNVWPLTLSVPVLAFLFGYSYAKRFTALSHVWLGVSLALSPIAVWIAVRANLEWTPINLALVVVFWVAGFDIIYATQDYEIDRLLRLHSVPATFGLHLGFRIAFNVHWLMLGFLFYFAWSTPELGVFFWIGVVLATLLVFMQHGMMVDSKVDQINVAFFYLNVMISTILFLATLADLTVKIVSIYLNKS